MVEDENLEFRLVELEKENLELTRQLHETQELFEKVFNGNKLKKPFSKVRVVNLDKRYGAVKIIKESLEYKIGTVIVKDSKSITKVLKLPFRILQEIKSYNKDQTDKKNNENISHFYDYPEALKLKSHLVYKVGSRVVESIDNPKRTPYLTIELLQDIYSFNKKK